MLTGACEGGSEGTKAKNKIRSISVFRHSDLAFLTEDGKTITSGSPCLALTFLSPSTASRNSRDRINLEVASVACTLHSVEDSVARPPGVLLKQSHEGINPIAGRPFALLASHIDTTGVTLSLRDANRSCQSDNPNRTFRLVILGFCRADCLLASEFQQRDILSSNQSTICFDNRLVQLSLAFVTYITHQTIHKA